jgi:hypothetical protein
MRRSRSLEERAAAAAYNSIARAAIRDGHIDPRGKTDTEIARALHQWVRSWPDDMRLIAVIDHRRGLLNHARRMRRSGEHRLAVLLFATWVEHWLNALVDARCIALRIAEKDKVEIVRSVQLAGKATWLLALLKARRLAANHVQSILGIAELRNAFVHYKWKGFDMDGGEDKKDADRYKAWGQKIERTIKYLQRYESRELLHSSERRVRNLGRSNKPLQPTRATQPYGKREAARSGPRG